MATTTISNSRQTPMSWEEEDDSLLISLKEEKKLGWKQIASHFNNRTSNACQFRWRRLKSGQLKSNHSSNKITKPRHNSTSSINQEQLIDNLEKKSDSSDDNDDDDDGDELFSEEEQEKVQEHNSTEHQQSKQNKTTWTKEEDELLLNKSQMNLTFDELSILLLTSKTNVEIIDRIQFLENRRKVSIASLLSDDETYFKGDDKTLNHHHQEQEQQQQTSSSDEQQSHVKEHANISESGTKFIFRNIIATSSNAVMV